MLIKRNINYTRTEKLKATGFGRKKCSYTSLHRQYVIDFNLSPDFDNTFSFVIGIMWIRYIQIFLLYTELFFFIYITK